jgi:hypothetical protein
MISRTTRERVTSWPLVVVAATSCRLLSAVVIVGHRRDCGHHATGRERCTFHGQALAKVPKPRDKLR